MANETVNSTTTVATELGRTLGIPAGVSLWIIAPAVLVIWILVFSLVKKASFAVIKKFAAGTKTEFDDVLFDALDLPVQLMIYATGILAAKNFLPAGTVSLDQYFLIGFKIVAILAVVLFIDKFLRGLVTLYALQVEILRTSGGIVQGVIRIVIMGLGGLVLLDSMGVSITPIIASLGIGSLAVALALQPTLENFFSGVQLIADKPIQLGQFIKLDSGEEGTVTKIGWRSTWICQPNNNTIVIPNKILVSSRVVNYFYPDTEIAVLVGVGVHYDSDLEQVERVTVDVAREIMQHDAAGVPGFEPFIRYHTFGDFSINFNVIMRAKDWPSSHLVKHAFIKKLHVRYAKEGIQIPYPMRTIVQAS